MSALARLTTAELFAALNRDFELLDSGEWIPDEDSINASRAILNEIEKRVKPKEPITLEDCDPYRNKPYLQPTEGKQ